MTQLPKLDPLTLLIVQIDSDLNDILADLRRDIDLELAKDAPDFARLERRITGRLTALFGLTPEALVDAPVGVYARAALTAARTLGGGPRLPVDLNREIEGDTTPARLHRAAVKLRGMLFASLAVVRDTPEGSPIKTKARGFFQNFLTVNGAANAIGATGDHGLYQIRRTLVTEATREHGVGVRYAAHVNGKTVRWILDPRHPSRDHCDVNAEADLYGLGRGYYPAQAVPKYPDHPHCLCRLVTA